ncbi:MAG: universal stress protein [Anaerolineae bacterium]|nr:universal stress protein [Anaerolineae bacterium]
MFKKIMVALDGSSLAEQVIPKAVEAAELCQAELILYRAVSPLAKSYRGRSAPASAIESTERQLLAMAKTYLEEIASGIREKGVSVNTVTVLGTPYQEIVEYAEKNEIDLLIMSTRGETGLTRWLLGSVTDHVIRGVSIPVWIIPPHNASKQP